MPYYYSIFSINVTNTVLPNRSVFLNDNFLFSRSGYVPSLCPEVAMYRVYVPKQLCPGRVLSRSGYVPKRLCPEVAMSRNGHVPKWLCPETVMSRSGYVPKRSCPETSGARTKIPRPSPAPTVIESELKLNLSLHLLLSPTNSYQYSYQIPLVSASWLRCTRGSE